MFFVVDAVIKYNLSVLMINYEIITQELIFFEALTVYHIIIIF